MTDQQKGTTTTTTKNNCGQWFLSEVCCCFCCCCCCCTDRPTTSCFGAVDVANGKCIDFTASFQLDASAKILFVKFVLWGFTLGSFIYAWVVNKHPYWFMAYLTNWTMLYSCLYLTMSLLVSFLVVLTLTNDQKTANFWIQATWIMFLVSAVHGIMVAILFWTTEYDPETYTIGFISITTHAVTFVIVLIDGQLINKIPVRLSHYFFCLTFGCLYIVWSVLQGLIPIDNPNKYGDDESLYSILDWANEPMESAVVTVLVLLVAFPIWTLVFWGLSLWGRRYESKMPEEECHYSGSGDGDLGNKKDVEQANPCESSDTEREPDVPAPSLLENE